MPYLGKGPASGLYRVLDDISSQFDGTKTNFELTESGAPVQIGAIQNLLISLSGVLQEPNDAIVAGNTTTSIKFNIAPLANQPFWGIKLGDVYAVSTVSSNTISSDKIIPGAVIESKLADGSVTTNKIGTGVVTSTKLANDSVINTKVLDGAITTAKVAEGNITTGKIADGAISFSKMSSAIIATVSDIITGAASKLVTASALSSILTKSQYQETSAIVSVVTTIPLDSSKPQVTEGTQVATLTVTPRNTTDKIRIAYSCVYSVTSGLYATFALFRGDDATGAVQTITDIGRNASGTQNCNMEYFFVPTSLTPITFTVRAGTNGGGAIYINGDTAGASLYGGSSKAYLSALTIPL